jgi:anti-sigma B factor antagonist
VHPDTRTSTVTPLAVPEIVALPAEVDITNATQAGDDLSAAVSSGAAIVIADMTLTEFCDSSGIRHLLIVNDRAVASNAELRLVITSPAVLRVLRVTGVDRMLRIYPSLQAALTNTASARPPENAGRPG